MVSSRFWFSRIRTPKPNVCLKRMRLLFIKGKLDNDEASMKILASDIYPMDRVREVLSRTVTIHINLGEAPQDIAERLQPVIDESAARPRLCSS